MEDLPYEILLMVIESCNFLTKIRLSCINKFFYENVQIHDLMNISKKYLFELNDQILKQKKFKNLKRLDARRDYDINQNGIDGLNLIELNVQDNEKIYNVTFMKNLKILNASNDCGIDQNGIQGLDLIELKMSNNVKIKNISFMKNLKILYVNGLKNIIDQQNIELFDLIELHASHNKHITNISFMKNLKILDASGNWQIRFYQKTVLANNKEPLSARYMWD